MPEVTNAANNTFQPKNILLNEVQCVSFSSFTLLTTYFFKYCTVKRSAPQTSNVNKLLKVLFFHNWGLMVYTLVTHLTLAFNAVEFLCKQALKLLADQFLQKFWRQFG